VSRCNYGAIVGTASSFQGDSTRKDELKAVLSEFFSVDNEMTKTRLADVRFTDLDIIEKLLILEWARIFNKEVKEEMERLQRGASKFDVVEGLMQRSRSQSSRNGEDARRKVRALVNERLRYRRANNKRGNK